MSQLMKYAIIFITTLSFLIGCNGGEMPTNQTQFPKIKDISASSWKKLAEKKIYFGHQSVGNNIIDGIWDLMKEHTEIQLDIAEITDPSDFDSALFAHFKVGKNGDPKSKIDAFANVIEQGIGTKIDIAFLKYCFVDIVADTDVKKVFTDYRSTMSLLKNKYPKTTFVHFTVPLVTTKKTWKTWIKELTGKKFIWEYDHNIARNKYNGLVISEYDGDEPIFDLAKIESTYSDGKRSSFTRAGKTYFSLVPDYTHDGGHLNEAGRKIVAQQLLIFLTNLVEQDDG